MGYVRDVGALAREHVRSTLRSIVRYNFKEGFWGFEHRFRIFADRDDSGLLLCTWPHGGRPEVPVRYCDEVWTGIEYQVGAHCIMEGLTEEGLKLIAALRERYSGTRRNPYNEIECGDHYARAMAGWSVLEALGGFRYDAPEDALSFAPVGAPAEFRVPFVTGSAWGRIEQVQDEDHLRIRISCAFGRLPIRKLLLGNVHPEEIAVTAGEKRPTFRCSSEGGRSVLVFDEPLILEDGSQLDIAGVPEGVAEHA